LFITPADRLDSGFFQNVSPTLKIIATFSVGFEHIDLEAAARRKIPVAYTLVSTVKQRPTSRCCFCWVLRAALTRLRNWFERERGSSPWARTCSWGGKSVAKSSAFWEWGAWDKPWRVEREDSE